MTWLTYERESSLNAWLSGLAQHFEIKAAFELHPDIIARWGLDGERVS